MKKELDFVKMDKTNIKEVIIFLEEENNSFPVSIKSRINISYFAKKILNNAEVYAYLCRTKIVGLIAFYANDMINKTAYLTYICVNEKYRSHKLGLNLMNAMFEECENKNMKKVKLSTNKRNIKAQKFYEQLGFKRIDEIDDTYLYKINI